MGKKHQPTPQSPASRPGAAAPKLEPEPAPAAVVDAAAAAAPEPASAASDAEEPTTPAPEAEPEPPAALRCRVTWHFAGFREQELYEGDEVDTDETEAAPYLGGVLTRLEAAE